MSLQSGLRRVVAYLIDYVVILIWMGLITLVALQGWFALEPVDQLSYSGRWTSQLTAFLMLTLPVWLYFTLCEAFGRKATLGKRVLKLRVDGSPRRIAARNTLKFLPWELAHTAIWHGMPIPLNSEPTGLGTGLFLLSTGLAALYLVTLFVGDGRTLYDRLSGTRVIRAA